MQIIEKCCKDFFSVSPENAMSSQGIPCSENVQQGRSFSFLRSGAIVRCLKCDELRPAGATVFT